MDMGPLKAFVFATLLIFVMAGSAQAAKPALVQLRWHRAVSGVTTVAANDRYLAYGTRTGLTLIDQRTHVRTELAGCATMDRATVLLDGLWLGGCPDPQAQPGYMGIYNIPGRYWLTVPVAPCGLTCGPVAVGSRWIELRDVSCSGGAHCSSQNLLQNIATGEVEPDPVGPHVHFRENLDSPSGTSPLCPPLRYPARYDSISRQFEPGELTMLGQFALTTDLPSDSIGLLQRCHSTWHHWLYGQALGSSRMVLWSTGWESVRDPNHGLLLRPLRRFNFYIPRRLHPDGTDLQGVALSGRTIYVLTASQTLWATDVPEHRVVAVSAQPRTDGGDLGRSSRSGSRACA